LYTLARKHGGLSFPPQQRAGRLDHCSAHAASSGEKDAGEMASKRTKETWEGGSLVGPHSQPGLQNLSDFVENLQKLADLARFDFRIWSTFAINCQILQSFFIKCQKIYQILNFADSVPPEFPRPTTKKGLQKKGNW
jgi:hypothetical protein